MQHFLTVLIKTIYEDHIQLLPCAYLHNYVDDGIITNPFYQEYIQKAPLFFKPDATKLRDFIKRYVKTGDKSQTFVLANNYSPR